MNLVAARRLLSALLLVLLTTAPAWADQTGIVDVLAFSADGKPVKDLIVETGDVQAKTGDDGIARLTLPAGRYTLVLRIGDRVVTEVRVPVAWGEVSEILLRLTPTPRVEIEAPGWPGVESEAPDESVSLGTVSGQLLDERNEKPVSGARILVRGELAEARSDAQGRYTLKLPAGKHTISVIHPEFSTLTRGDVLVVDAGVTSLDLRLTPSSIELETHRVTGYKLEGGLASLLDERRTDSAVTEVIGADQMSKSGDSDAAEALKRVTGLTVVGGKYVYVRGMGERYSSTLLDGATLPSPEPERRVVPLSLFPTDVIESISIRKSYSPDLPGEFGGGAVVIRSKQTPKEQFAKASVSTTYKDGTTGRGGYTYEGGHLDWMGFDDGTRALPQHVKTAGEFEAIVLQDPITGEGYSEDLLEVFGEIMPNKWTATKRKVGPDVSFDLAAGGSVDTSAGLVGYRGAMGYGHSNQIRRGVLRTLFLGSGGVLEPTVDYRVESLQTSNTISTLFGFTYAPSERHMISLSGLGLHAGKDEATIYQGVLTDIDTVTRITRLSWIEEDMVTSRLRGEHTLGEDIEVKWGYSYSLASRYQPDWRQTRYDFNQVRQEFVLSNRPEGNQRLYNDLFDNNHDLGFDLGVPFEVFGDQEAKISAGASLIYRDRKSETRRFKFLHRGANSLDPDILAQPAELVFSPQNIGPGGFSFEEITRATDNYEASQTISAAYINLEMSLTDAISFAVGARVERSRQRVETFNLFSRAPSGQTADLDDTDILPAINLTFRLREDMQIRAGYSRTLSRPDFRELSEAPFDQVVGAGVFIGNPNLERTLIDNLDLRWEWYLSEDETLSLGVFYKKLRKPIESVVLGGSNRTLTLENADSGENVGIELEYRRGLGFISDVFEHVYAAGNIAFIRSEVELDSQGIATESNRPLQGQSEYVLNLSLGYDDPDTGNSLAILYNVAGERIVGIGTLGLPDIYEQPVHKLDVVGRWSINDVWSLKVKAENLLDPKIKQTQDDEVVESYRLGRSISFELGASF